MPLAQADFGLRELGDFENYFAVMQRDMKELADLLEAANRAEQSPSTPASPTGG